MADQLSTMNLFNLHAFISHFSVKAREFPSHARAVPMVFASMSILPLQLKLAVVTTCLLCILHVHIQGNGFHFRSHRQGALDWERDCVTLSQYLRQTVGYAVTMTVISGPTRNVKCTQLSIEMGKLQLQGPRILFRPTLTFL